MYKPSLFGSLAPPDPELQLSGSSLGPGLWTCPFHFWWEELRVNFFVVKKLFLICPLTNGPGNNGETPNTQLPRRAVAAVLWPKQTFTILCNSRYTPTPLY